MRYKIRDGDIQRVAKNINVSRRRIFKGQQRYLVGQFKQLRSQTYRTTMVATGETREKLFNKSGIAGSRYFKCVCGYNPTSNNQSVSQEFEEDNKVHRTVEEHYRYLKSGERTAKCSRHPNDLYTLFGKKYDSNSSARRGALAWSVRKIFAVPTVGVYRAAGGFSYGPDLSRMAWRLAVVAKNIIGR